MQTGEDTVQDRPNTRRGCVTPDRSLEHRLRKHDVLIDQHVEPVSRSDFQSRLDIEVARQGLLRHLAEAFGK